ncbi:hypothetical protein [Salinibaculum salinum]|uniref:hypothetical protein n=1 Tax=Salinibaculum salinum TaxID=3131996 RepID=UPI0030EDA498
MRDALHAPPWGNLWRHLVTTYLFFLVIGFTVALLTDFDGSTGWQWSGTLLFIAAGAYVLAAIVVWSDIPWPGDPE